MAGNDGGSAIQQRLDSWKEIGAYFGRDERTVKRWETERGLPVHRVPGSGRGRVYAYPEELSHWLQGVGAEVAVSGQDINSGAKLAGATDESPPPPRPTVAAVTFSPLEFNHGGAATARAPESAPRLSLVHRSVQSSVQPGIQPNGQASGVLTGATVAAATAAQADIATHHGNATPAMQNLPSQRLPGRGRYWLAVLVCVAVLGAWLIYGWHHRRVQQADQMLNSAANAQAENLYLQGKFFFQQRTPESLTKAVDMFTQAIVHDPHYAPAYAGLAECYELLREFSDMPDREAFPRALSAAQQAVQLNPNMAQGHAALAFALFYWSWDTRRALQEFDLALKQDPNAAQTHHWYATSLMTLGEGDKALAQIEEAQKLDPGSRAIVADKGWILTQMNRLDQAEALLRQVEQSDPQFVPPHVYLSWIALKRGDGAEFAREARLAGTLSHDAERGVIADLAEAAYKSGGKVALTAAIDQHTREVYAKNQSVPASMADVLMRAGDVAGAFKMLDEAFLHRDPGTRFLLMSSTWDPYRQDARFIALQEKLGVDMAALGH